MQFFTEWVACFREVVPTCSSQVMKRKKSVRGFQKKNLGVGKQHTFFGQAANWAVSHWDGVFSRMGRISEQNHGTGLFFFSLFLMLFLLFCVVQRARSVDFNVFAWSSRRWTRRHRCHVVRQVECK